MALFSFVFTLKRVATELRGIREAIVRVADALELSNQEAGLQTGGLKSWYQSDSPQEAAYVLMQDDEEYARYYEQEQRQERAGFPAAIDEELEEE